jgi:hypothetical protein
MCQGFDQVSSSSRSLPYGAPKRRERPRRGLRPNDVRRDKRPGEYHLQAIEVVTMVEGGDVDVEAMMI